MTAVTFPLRLPRLAFAICGWRWQNDMHEIKYSVSFFFFEFFFQSIHLEINLEPIKNEMSQFPNLE